MRVTRCLKKRILRVRGADDDEFRIELVSINSVRAGLTISWFQASVRSNVQDVGIISVGVLGFLCILYRLFFYSTNGV